MSIVASEHATEFSQWLMAKFCSDESVFGFVYIMWSEAHSAALYFQQPTTRLKTIPKVSRKALERRRQQAKRNVD